MLISTVLITIFKFIRHKKSKTDFRKNLHVLGEMHHRKSIYNSTIEIFNNAQGTEIINDLDRPPDFTDSSQESVDGMRLWDPGIKGPAPLSKEARDGCKSIVEPATDSEPQVAVKNSAMLEFGRPCRIRRPNIRLCDYYMGSDIEDYE